MGGSRLFQCLVSAKPSNLGITLPWSTPPPNWEARTSGAGVYCSESTHRAGDRRAMSSASKSGRLLQAIRSWRPIALARSIASAHEHPVPVIPRLRDPYGGEKSGARAKDDARSAAANASRMWPMHQGQASLPRFPCAPPFPDLNSPPRI
jgi:hypothetical protein